MPLLLTGLAAGWRFVNGNLVASLMLCGVLVGGYVGLTVYHYDRGWSARDRELAEHVRQLNEELAALGATLERTEAERVAAVRAATLAVEQAWHAEPPADLRPTIQPDAPRACPMTPQMIRAACGLPDAVRASLNKIR